MTHHSLSEQIAAAARELEGEFDQGATMDKAVSLSVQVVASAEEAGISLLHGCRGGIDTPAATSDLVRRIDELQYHFDEGPCLDAIRESETTYSPDVGTDDRWPRWGPAAAEETGVRSMMCFRLFTHGDKLGALNLYSRASNAFDDDDREQGLAIAAHTAIAVAAVQEIDQLKAGMDSRTLIGQAQGILMERFGMDAHRAFAVLTRLASQTNRKLRDIAYEIVQTRLLPDGRTS
jgi:GAF domain-containing protein